MITKEEADYLFTYNPEDGRLIWKVSVKGTRGKGKQAGTLAHNGYVDVCVRGKKYGAHRIAFLIMEGAVPKCVDHKNGNKADNRWSNLRPATYSENGYNYKGTGSTTGYKNVYVDQRYPNKYFAQIRVFGKTKRLGTFTCIEEANKAACAGRIKYCGLFINHGV